MKLLKLQKRKNFEEYRKVVGKRYVDEVTVKLNVQNAQKPASMEFDAAGFKWKLSTFVHSSQSKAAEGNSAATSSARMTSPNYLGVKLEAKVQSEGFSLKVSGDFSIRHHESKKSLNAHMHGYIQNVAEVKRSMCTIFRPNARIYVVEELAPVDHLMGKASPFTEGNRGNFTVELRLRVATVEMKQFPVIDFRKSTNSRTQHKIKVQDPKSEGRFIEYYAEKGVLKFHANFFRMIFSHEDAQNSSIMYSENEFNTTIIKRVKGYSEGYISPKAFLSLLKLIHSIPTEISPNHVLQLLRYAEYAEIPIVKGHCEAFLIGRRSYSIPMSAKLEMADRFNLYELKARLFMRMRVKEDAQRLFDASKKQKGAKRVDLSETACEWLARRAEQVPSLEEIQNKKKERDDARMAARMKKLSQKGSRFKGSTPKQHNIAGREKRRKKKSKSKRSKKMRPSSGAGERMEIA